VFYRDEFNETMAMAEATDAAEETGIRLLVVGYEKWCSMPPAPGERGGAPLEIGWRLVPEHNGKGYATEAAKAIVDYAVERVGASYLVAVADPENIASQRVMKRLGMSYKAIERHYDTECVVYELNMSKPA
jgi:hypothetical protein